MTPLTLRSLSRTACALAVLAFVGCGGENTDSAATAQGAVQITQEGEKLTVSANDPHAAAGQAAAMMRWGATQYTLTATTTAGAAAAWSGMLILRSEAEDNVTEVEGRLVPAAAAPDAAGRQPAAPLLAEMRARIEDLRRAFAAALEPARRKLEADLAAATTDAQRKAALETFGAAFKALYEKLQKDITAVMAEYADRLAALGVRDPAGALRGALRERRDSRHGLEVEGTIDAAGAVKLTIELGDDMKVLAIGKLAADGTLSGTYTGPAATDAGKWTATLGKAATPPAPPPSSASAPPTPAPPATPAAAGDAVAGAAQYAAACAGCHGADPKTNTAKVRNTTSVAALDAAIAQVREMRPLAAMLTAKNKLDIVAFINK